METSDWIAAGALLVAAVNSVWTFVTHRRQRRLDEDHRSLERTVLDAEIADRAEAERALLRRLRLLVEQLSEQVSELQNRKPTPDGIRGAVLWNDAQLKLLRDEASAVSDTAAEAGGEVVTALSFAADMARPHLVKDVRVMVGQFDSERFTFELRTAERGLKRLYDEVTQALPSGSKASVLLATQGNRGVE